MKKAIIIFLFFIIGSISSSAQKNYKNGWVVLNDKDTVTGKILLKGWNINPTSITFKQEKEINYEIKDIVSFGIYDEPVLYRRFEITKHLTPNNESAEYTNNEDSVASSVQWLELLVAGKNALYFYADIERNYFFYEDAENKAVELEYSNGIKNFGSEEYKDDPRYGKTGIVENLVFKNQLLQLADSKGLSNELGRLVNTLSYTSGSLSTYFEKLNKTIRKDKNKMVSDFGIGAGVIYNTSSTIGESGTTFANTTIKNILSPYIKIIYELNSTNKNKKLSFNGNLVFTNLNTTGKKNPISDLDSGIVFDLKNTFLEFNPMVRLTLNPLAKIKFYIEAGFNTINRISGKNTEKKIKSNGSVVEISKKLSVSSFWVAPLFSIGIKYNSFSVYANYQPKRVLTYYVNSRWNVSSLSIGVAYRFRK